MLKKTVNSKLSHLAIFAPFAVVGTLPASAANWWLPTNYSEHGVAVDHLFAFIFWLTSAVMVGVFGFMIYFLVKYRYNPERKKAHFSHGNQKLEMIWTIIPAIILVVIALWSKRVWDTYHFANANDTRKPARLLVIGQQFKWNVIYAGPDNKIGKYLVFPKPTDRLWPKNADGTPFTFTFGKYEDTKGPADMPFDDACKAINAYIEQENPLGKVFDDPDGKDDDWDKIPGREICVPVNRPVEVQLSSKDVIHDFFLPNFRVKLDAVPGLRGVVHFTPTLTSREREQNPANRQTYKLDELTELMKLPQNAELLVSIGEKSLPKAPDDKSPGVAFDKKEKQWVIKGKDGKPLLRDGGGLTPQSIAKLKEIGVQELETYKPGYFELVCEELCGAQHNTMRGTMRVLTDKEFIEQFETPKAKEEASAGAPQTVAVQSR